MKTPATFLLALACLLPAASANPPAGDQYAEIGALVTRLADENFKTREEATRRIWDLGEVALPALKEAAAAKDPERALRARDLLLKIELAITPDTPPEIQTLVARYTKANPQDKMNLMHELRRRGAWRQMLKLYAKESVPATRELLRRAVDGVAVLAARERLVAGDAEEARGFLEIAEPSAQSLMSLAAFHRSQGTLDEAREAFDAADSGKSAAWRLALLRATGDIEAARQQALKAGEPRIAATMAMLAGDPLPWLSDSRNAELPGETRHYPLLAAKRWQGKTLRESDLEQLVRMANSKDEDTRISGMNALFLLGETASAEAAFIRHYPVQAFLHFETLERLDKAHKALGLDPAEPDYRGWLAPRLRELVKINAGDDESDDGSIGQELLLMANFLERRGFHDVLADAFSGPMKDLAAAVPTRFTDFLSMLFGTGGSSSSGASRLALHLGAQWAGDDPDRWEEVMISAFGEEEEYRTWWQWLEKLQPGSKPRQRMAAMLALFDYGRDHENLRDDLLATAWKAVGAAAEEERKPLLQNLIALSDIVGDVATGIRARDLLPGEEETGIQHARLLVQLTAANRWNEVAEIFLRQIARLADSRQSPRPDLHAYAAASLRRAGRPEEAEAHDAWAEKLSLGEANTSVLIGQGYAFGGEFERAGTWFGRAILEVDPGSGMFAYALRMHHENLLEESRWREAAACAEVIAVMGDSSGSLPFQQMRQRMQADLARALSILDQDRPRAIALLEQSHRMFPCDGTLADHFFPGIRKAGLIREHDQWFEESWKQINEVIARHPESDNSMNTAGWLASRAVRRLKEAKSLLHKALALNPRQAAYLDTMAEIEFASGNRKKALEWSQLSVNHSPEDQMIRRQHARFLTGAFPF